MCLSLGVGVPYRCDWIVALLCWQELTVSVSQFRGGCAVQ